MQYETDSHHLLLLRHYPGEAPEKAPPRSGRGECKPRRFYVGVKPPPDVGGRLIRE